GRRAGREDVQRRQGQPARPVLRLRPAVRRRAVHRRRRPLSRPDRAAETAARSGQLVLWTTRRRLMVRTFWSWWPQPRAQAGPRQIRRASWSPRLESLEDRCLPSVLVPGYGQLPLAFEANQGQ